MQLSIFEFGNAKAIVCLCKDLNHSLQCVETTREASAAPCKDWNIMPKIGIDAFDGKRVAFVMNISDMCSRIDDIRIANIAVRAIKLSIWSVIDYFLYIRSILFTRHSYPRKQTRLTTYHCENIRIFARISMWLFFNEPKQFIRFEYRKRTFNSHFVFLSRYKHWSCSC